MSNDSGSGDISRELHDIKDQLNRIEKQSRFGSEDQFFFAISFSLLILFLTLPMNDAMAFLTNFGLSDKLAISTANGIRGIGIIAALAASLLRYYGSMSNEHICKEKRVQSITTLLMGFWFFVFIIGANAFSSLSYAISLVTIPFGVMILAFLYVVLGILEKRLLSFYASKHLIQKSDVIPVASITFLFICTSYYLALASALVASLFAPSIVVAVAVVSFVVFFVIQERLYHRMQKHKKIGRSKSQPKFFQKTLTE